MARFLEKFKLWSRQSATGRDKRGWSTRVVIKYTLLQIPAVVLLILVLLLIKDWLGIPPWLVWSIVGFWIAKDVALFPLVWRSYDPDFPAHAHSLVGAIGVTQESLAPRGYVRVRGELWQAVVPTGTQIPKGQRVWVRDVRGLMLIVEAEEQALS